MPSQEYLAEEARIRAKWYAENQPKPTPAPQAEPAQQDAQTPRVMSNEEIAYRQRQGISAIGAGVGRTIKAAQPPKATTEVPVAKEYMALDVLENGMQFYGTGLQKWARKTFADVFDPQKFEVSAEVKEDYTKAAPQVAKRFEELTKWDKWGEKLFGITAEEVTEGFMTVAGAGETARQKVEAGEKTQVEYVGEGLQQAVGGMQDLFGGIDSGVIGGGLQLLSIDDTLVRKVNAMPLALESLAGEQSVNLGLAGMGLFGVIGNAKGVISNLATGKITTDDVRDTVKNYWKGSEAIYSMAYSQMIQDRFDEEVAAGRDPRIVAEELLNPWVEFGGSLAFSPSTYLGLPVFARVGKALGIAPEMQKSYVFWGKMKPVYRLPTFGQMLNISAGSVRLAKTADRLDDLSGIPGADEAFARLGKVQTDVEAMKVVDGFAETVAKSAQKVEAAVAELANVPKARTTKQIVKDIISGSFGFTSYTNAAKVSTTKREMKTVLSVIMKNSETIDDAMFVVKNMVMLAQDPTNKRAIFNLMDKGGKLPFTDSGRMTGQILAKMGDAIAPIMKKLEAGQVNQLEVANDLFGGMAKVIDDIIPSVEDMAKAARKGADATDKEKALAEMYKTVPQYVKALTAVNEKTIKAKNLGVSAMVNVYMRFSPAYANRNIIQNGVGVFADLSLGDALAVIAKQYKGVDGVFGSTKWTDEVVNSNLEQVKSIIGFIPEAAQRGVGDLIGDLAKQQEKATWGFLQASQNAERIASSEIVLRAARNEMSKALPNLIQKSGFDELSRIIPKEQSNLLYKLLIDNFGDFDKAAAEFRKVVGGGEIEAWRYAQLPKKMQEFLDNAHQGDAMRDLMRNAKNPDEFTEGVAKIVDRIQKEADKVFNEPQGGEGFAAQVNDMFVHVTEALKDKSEVFRRKVAWLEKSRVHLKDGALKAVASMGEAVGAMKAQGRFQPGSPEEDAWYILQETVSKKIASEAEFYAQRQEVLSKVLDLQKLLKNKKPLSLAEFLDKARVGGWSLKGFFPDADFASMNREQLLDALWKSYKGNSSVVWKEWNDDFFNTIMGELGKFSEQQLASKLEDVVGSYKSKENPFALAIEARTKAKAFEEIENGFGLPDTVSAVAKQYGMKGNAKEIVNTVNKYLETKVKDLSEVTTDMLKRALEAKGVKPLDADTPLEELAKIKSIPPAAYDFGQPSMARGYYESMKDFKRDMQALQDKTLGDWGKTVKTLPGNIDNALNKFSSVYKANHKTVQTKAGLFANGLRDFVLHDYEKTNLDLAMSYLMPFQYWTTRTYMRWTERLIENPKYANAYLAYKDWATREHADLPEFMRNGTVIPTIPGIENDPLFFNLEATLNPLYGLLGSDFNDPYKRVDWVSRFVDDMNKSGPTLAPIYNWAVAMNLYAKGEDDAAQRWVGRTLPQTGLIKTILNKFGADINIGPLVKNNEFDPGVSLLMDGFTPYERNKLARNLAGLEGEVVELDGVPTKITSEMIIEASAKKSGAVWEYAVRDMATEQFGGQTFSFFAGVGFKPRTQNDVEIERFYGDYHKVLAAKSLMSPDEYRAQWDKLREDYPFMDALLISKKSGADMETALAYNVLGRIPPGEMSDIAGLLGVKPYMISSFYDNKGLDKLAPQDKQRFMSAIVDLSAILQMPDGASKQEWTMAKRAYSDMEAELKREFGDDILDQMNALYDMPDNEKQTYLELFPKVQEAMNAKNEYIVWTPLLSAYYGSIDTVSRYYTTQMYMQLEKEFGDDIQQKVDYYVSLLNEGESKAASAYKKQYLADYYKRKDELQTKVNLQTIQTAQMIPERKDYAIRPDFVQGQATGLQEEMLQYINTDQQQQLAQEMYGQLSEATVSFLNEYYQGGELTKAEMNAMENSVDYVARRYGLSLQEALRLLGLER